MSTTASFVETRAVRIPEEGSFAVVSTSHISSEDADILKILASAKSAPVMVAVYPNGFILSLLPSDDADVDHALHDMKHECLSQAFRDLWKGMRDRGYSILQLDSDGSVLSGYPVFSW